MRKSQKLLAVLSLLGIVLLGGGNLFAQNRTCSGTVTDAQGEPVIAASVLIKDAPVSTGVMTDLDGKFVQPNAKVGDVLVISCIGYATTEVTWNGSPLNIVMEDDQNLLNETVVTAYGGRTLRSKLTNSISTVKSETIASGMHAQAAQSLAGAVAGLAVRQTSGDPNSTPTMILRGGTGLKGTGSPLVIVDGVQRSMTDINPADIESIEVMKDAGATAIYGALAANGVILVTTKRGQEGTSSINLRAKTSINYLNSPMEFFGSEEYLYYMRSAYWRSSHYWQDSEGNWRGATNTSSLAGQQPYGTGNRYFDASGNVLNGNTSAAALWGVYAYSSDLDFLLSDSNWGRMKDPVGDGDLVFWNGATVKDINIKSPAVSQDYGVDFQGGNDKGHYYASIGYNHSEGNAVDNDYDRLTFVFNGDYKIRPWLTSISSFNFAHVNYTPIKNGNSEAYYFNRSWSVPPTYRVYNADGEYNPSPRNSVQDGIVALYNAAYDYTRNTDKFNFGQTFQVTFTPWLNLKVSGNWYYYDYFEEQFEHDYLYGANRWNRTRYSSDYYSRELDQNYNAILNFNKTFGLYHNVSTMLGVELVDRYSRGFSASGQGAATDEFQDLALTETGETRSIDSWHNQNRSLSYFGKFDYDYDSKYLLSAVFRYDGYSRLLDPNRWSFFPGVSAGWVFSKEDFMAPTRDIISFAKLRMSYGANGILDTNYIGNYTLQGAYGSQTNYNGVGGRLLTTLPNPGLRWEKSWTFETGLDVSFLENRYNLNLTYYNRHTSDKIASITLPSHVGTTSYISNNGEVQNQGVEIEFNARLVNTRDWKVNFGLNAAYNRNKIIKLPDNGLARNMQDAFQVYVPGSYDPSKVNTEENPDLYLNNSDYVWVGGLQEGQSYGDIYSFKYGGLYQSWDDIPGDLIDRSSGNNGANNRVLYGPAAWKKLTDAQKASGYPIQPGDVRWEDVNGDGIIDNYDKVKLGNIVPKWTGGFNLSASFRNLTLSGRFDYALDYKVVDNVTPWIMGNMQGTFNTLTLARDTFVYQVNPDGTETITPGKYPTYVWADQLGKRNYARANNPIFVYEGSYLAIREITLSYALPETLLKNIFLKRASVFVSGQNLGYISEAARLGSPEYGASSWGTYTLPRTVIFGANLTF